jgi:hypothetical protein
VIQFEKFGGSFKEEPEVLREVAVNARDDDGSSNQM